MEHLQRQITSPINSIAGIGKIIKTIAKIEEKRDGKSCMMLPIQYKKYIFKLLDEHKVKARVLEVFG